MRRVIYAALAVIMMVGVAGADDCGVLNSTVADISKPVCGPAGCKLVITCANGQTMPTTWSHDYYNVKTCGDIKTVWENSGGTVGMWMEYGMSCRRLGVSDSAFSKKMVTVAKTRVADPYNMSVAAAQLHMLHSYLNIDDDDVSWKSHCENSGCEETMATGSVYVHGGQGPASLRFQVKSSPLSTDQELATIAKKRGVKLGDKQVLARILVAGSREAMISKRADICRKDDGSKGESDFISWMARTENVFIEGLHEAPLSTMTLAKTLLELPTTRYIHAEVCAKNAREEAIQKEAEAKRQQEYRKSQQAPQAEAQ